MSTLRVNTLQNTSGVEVYTAKAWVNFNGTGTVAIRAAGNVSSITDNGTGDYTVNFTTAMPDENYAVTVGTTSFGNGASAQDGWGISGSSNPTASSLRMLAGLSCASATLGDIPQCHIAIFR